MSRWNSANVIQAKPALSQLWKYSAEGERFAFIQGQTFLPSESFPQAMVGKTWRSAFRRTFNLAWLPSDQVYLRVIHLPSSDPAEVASMVELQLEKLSPLPVAQISWSFEFLPKSDKPDALQTVIVVIVERAQVDAYLGGLETRGFLADHLEVPCLDQLLVTKAEDDGVWIYLGSEGEPALIAWWYGGILQNLALVTLPVGENREFLLRNQLEQMAWGGELEGWLTSPPRIHLVAEPAEVAFWEPLMRNWSELPLQIITPLAAKDLAALAAARSLRETSKSNLMPPEYAVRYRQQFIDGLWLKGIMAALAIYGVVVVVYLTALFVLNRQLQSDASYLAGITRQYKEALQDKERIQVIKDRQELKYAALDCWRAAAESLPQGLVLEKIFFTRGRFDINGTAPLDQTLDITSFNEAMRKTKVNGEPLFVDVSPPVIKANAQTANWSFSCTLKGEK